jgi:hypothetical protein
MTPPYLYDLSDQCGSYDQDIPDIKHNVVIPPQDFFICDYMNQDEDQKQACPEDKEAADRISVPPAFKEFQHLIVPEFY